MRNLRFKIIIRVILAVFIISGCRKKNHPPFTPYTPNGPTSGVINDTYQFFSLASDPEEDSVSIRFDFGNDDTSDWSELVAKEKTVEISFAWSVPDTYFVRAQAMDNNENISQWSLSQTVIIALNHPLETPSIPFGPSTGYVGFYYQFSSLAIDPDSDRVAIRFDWGDDSISDWSDWLSSGDSVKMWHSWAYPDTFYVKAQTKDKFGAVSDWSAPATIAIDIKELGWICATNSAGWSPRESHASVVFDNKMWVIGGNAEGHTQTDVWCSSNGINWTCVINSAEFVGDDTRAVVFDNKIWVLGGTELGGARSDVWCSSDGVNWTCVTDSAQWPPRKEHSVVVFENKIWVLGGYDSNFDILNDVWFSTDGINWICATNFTGFPPRIEPAVVVFNNKIWIMGGEVSRHGLNDVWYSYNGSDWILATDSAPWQRRYYHTAVVYDKKMWVLAGRVEIIGESNDVWYSTDGYNWIRDCPLLNFALRSDHSAVVFDNKIWVMGGFGYGVALRNDVWYRTVIEK